ncbi:hypothetical protein FRC07_010845 [Ceratobasidium sp. 392]|nr:hypothetical protein FRC07_010845 [Ceratobasidium sp. 392]
MIIPESEHSDSKAPTVRSGDSEAPGSPPPYAPSLSPQTEAASDAKPLPSPPLSPYESSSDFGAQVPPGNLPPPCNYLLENNNDHSIKGVWHVDTALAIPEALRAPLEDFDGAWNETDMKKRKKDKGKRKSSDPVPAAGPDAGVRPNLMLRSKNGSITGEVHVVSSDGVVRPGLVVAEGHNGSVTLEVNSYATQPLRIFAISKNGSVRVRIPQSFEGAVVVSTHNGSVNISDSVKSRLTTFSATSGTRGFIGDWQAAKFGSTPTPASPALSLDPASDPPLPTIPADPFTTWTGPLVHVLSHNGSVHLSFVAEGPRPGSRNGGGWFRGFMSGWFGGDGGEGGRRGGRGGPWGPGGEGGAPWGGNCFSTTAINMVISTFPFYTTATAASLLLARYLWKRWAALSILNLPPSPKGYPIVGNVFSLPSELEHLAYMELSTQLNSDLIFLKMFDFNLVVLNSAEAASDLMEKRSGIYSDRACPNMVKDPTLFDWSKHMSLLGYTDLWRSHRRMMNIWLNVRASSQFHELQERQARVLLGRLLPVSELAHPHDKMLREFNRSMAASIFQTVYGYHVEDVDDKFFAGLREALDNLFKASMRTNFLVNTFPILSYIPDWMPGTQWKRVAREWKAQKDWAVDSVYQWSKDRFVRGDLEPSVLRSVFGHEVTSQWTGEDADDHLKEMAIIVCAGALDPPSNTILKFVAAMLLNPHTLEKAQQEVDLVTGQNRLPTMSDRHRMPYVQNVISEVMRWHPVLPMGMD